MIDSPPWGDVRGTKPKPPLGQLKDLPAMTDAELNDRLNAISGKLDRVLHRQAESQARDKDILARLARLGRELLPPEPKADIPEES